MKNKFILASFLILIGSFLPIAPALAAQTCTPFSNTYLSGTSTGIQDGGNAVATYQSPLWAPAFPGAIWIWSSQFVQNPQRGGSQIFVLSFNLPASVASSTLEISADDYFTVAINGIQVDSQFGEGNFFQAHIHTYHTPQLFHQGANNVTFTVVNAPYFYAGQGTVQNNPAGLLFRLGVEGASCIDSPTDTPTSGGGSSGYSGGGGGSVVISGPLSYGYQTPPPPAPITPPSAPILPPVTIHSDRSGTGSGNQNTVAGHVVDGDAAGTGSGNGPESTTSSVTDMSNSNSALVATAGFLPLSQSFNCFLKSFLLIAFMVLGWWVIAYVINGDGAKSQKIMLRKEMLFYAVTSILLILGFKYFGDQCGLISFLVLAILLMIGRTIQATYSDRS